MTFDTEWEHAEIAAEIAEMNKNKEEKMQRDTNSRIHRINEACNEAAADTLRRAITEVGKYSWTSSDQRAVAVLGYMISHAVQFHAVASGVIKSEDIKS